MDFFFFFLAQNSQGQSKMSVFETLKNLDAVAANFYFWSLLEHKHLFFLSISIVLVLDQFG